MSQWNDEGSHFIQREGRHRRIETYLRSDGTWLAAVDGCLSTYGVTRGNAIRNACAPVDRKRAAQSMCEYLDHRNGKLSDEDYIACIRLQHQEDLERFWADARAHGEA